MLAFPFREPDLFSVLPLPLHPLCHTKQDPEASNESTSDDDEGAQRKAPAVERHELKDVLDHDFGRELGGADGALGEAVWHLGDGRALCGMGLEQQLEGDFEAAWI